MNGLKTYNTYPGVICTLLLMSFVMYSFIQMVNDIQNGANPVTSKTSLYLSQNEVIDIVHKTRASHFLPTPLFLSLTLVMQMEFLLRILLRKLIIL